MLYQLNPYVHSVLPLSFEGGASAFMSVPECRILYSRSASFTVYLENEQVKFLKNSFIFLPPDTPYAVGQCTIPDGEAVEISFDLTDERVCHYEKTGEWKVPTSPSEYGYHRMIWFADAMHLMEELENVVATFESSEPYAHELCSAKLKIILLKMLANDMTVTRGVTSMRVRRAIRYIEAHYAEPITNEEIAASVNLHPYYLSRLLREECGVGLHRYLLNYRLAVAARMLEAGEDNVENISAQCGFSYSSHFINAFRSAYGMTPHRYAKTHGMKR